MPGETNMVHEEAIWRQRLKHETEGAEVWHSNWGFLADKPQPEARGFSTNVAKYSYGQGQWSVKTVRVPSYMSEIVSRWKATAMELSYKLGRQATTGEIAEELDLPESNWDVVRDTVQSNSQPVHGMNEDSAAGFAEVIEDIVFLLFFNRFWNLNAQ